MEKDTLEILMVLSDMVAERLDSVCIAMELSLVIRRENGVVTPVIQPSSYQDIKGNWHKCHIGIWGTEKFEGGNRYEVAIRDLKAEVEKRCQEAEKNNSK